MSDRLLEAMMQPIVVERIGCKMHLRLCRLAYSLTVVLVLLGVFPCGSESIVATTAMQLSRIRRDLLALIRLWHDIVVSPMVGL